MSSPIDSSINTQTSDSFEMKDERTVFDDSSECRVGPWPNSTGKRAFDMLASGSALIVISPLFLLIAIIIKMTSRGPVFFKQLRMGKGNIPFSIYKFRTMRTTETHGPLVTRKNDSRITFAGKALRRFKLDELPQLYNVLRGDMSLVGPRPKVIGHEHNELHCKPGITGAATLMFAQEHHLLGQIPEDKVDSFTVEVLHKIKAQVDRKYELDSTFLTDMEILIQTPVHISGLRRPSTLQALAEVTNTKAFPVTTQRTDQEAEAIYFQGFPPVEKSIATETSRNSTY